MMIIVKDENGILMEYEWHWWTIDGILVEYWWNTNGILVESK